MTRRPEPALRRTLLRWLLAPLMALLLLDGVVAYWSSLRAADLAHDRSLNELARELALHVVPGADGPRLALTPAAERILLVDEEDRIAFRITDLAGRLLGGDVSLPLPAPMPEAGAPPRFYADRVQGEDVRVVAALLSGGDGPAAGPVLVQVAETRRQRNAMARELMLHAIVPQVLLIALAAAVVWMGVGHGLQPVQALRAALARRSHRDLQPLEADRVPADLRPLVHEMNGLMQRLGLTLEAQSRFIADAAHQLKTPVSGLKAQLELALREEDPQRLRRSLAQLHVGVERMSRLVQQLLALARSEPEAAASLAMAPIDLGALALEVGMEWVPQALRRRIDLGFDPPPAPVVVRGDADRLRELLNNLVDNAVRYSQEDGRVTVAVRRAGGEACLSVHDDGPRIPDAERQRVFERFHRLLDAPADGSGLGLAIVREIAQLHGARITLDEDDDGVGNTFRVWFPLAPV